MAIGHLPRRWNSYRLYALTPASIAGQFSFWNSAELLLRLQQKCPMVRRKIDPVDGLQHLVVIFEIVVAELPARAGNGDPHRVPFGRVDEDVDRKSTRLNSSHLGISY